MSSRRANVLIVSDYDWPTGGIEQFVRELLDRAAQHWDCRLLTWSRSALVPSGFDSLHAVQHGDVASAWESMASADAIVLVTSFNVRLLARLTEDFARSHSTPVVTVVQTSSHSNPSAPSVSAQTGWLRDLASVSQAVVAVSREVEDSIGEATVGGEDVRCVVIENGARLTSSSPRARGRRVVSFIGRPHPQKGVDHFERLALSLRGRGLRFRSNTVSVPPARHVEGVEYSSNLSDRELVEFFDGTDVLIAPYRHSDGLPLALLEAVNCGVPVIGFDVPGVGRLLQRHGQCVLPPTYDALESAVRDWSTGRLDIEPPTPGSVRSWDKQIADYLDVVAASCHIEL